MKSQTPPLLYLASQSPRRRELLAQLGLEPESVVIEIDETPEPGESPEDYVLRLARAKAKAGLAAVSAAASEVSGRAPPVTSNGRSESPLILAADTAVVCESRILGKPADEMDARRMLQFLAGRAHRVMTAIATQGRYEHALMVETCVQMRVVSEEEISAYWQTGEPQDKAGAYAIQGLGAVFIERIQGSYSNVVGLPLFETAAMLKAAGIHSLNLAV